MVQRRRRLACAKPAITCRALDTSRVPLLPSRASPLTQKERLVSGLPSLSALRRHREQKLGSSRPAAGELGGQASGTGPRQSHETCCCPNIDTMLAPKCPDGTVTVLATEQGTCLTCARGEGGTEVCVRVNSVPCSPPMMPARSLIPRERELAGKWGKQLCGHKWRQQRWRGLPQTCW